MIRSLRTPLLVLHGKNDEVIPPSHGPKLVEASPASDKPFSLIRGAGHQRLGIALIYPHKPFSVPPGRLMNGPVGTEI